MATRVRIGRSRVAAALVVTLLIAGASFIVAPPASAAIVNDPAAAASILAKINTQRVTDGKGPLVDHAFIRTLSERHSRAMARLRRLGHFGFKKRVAAIYANDAGIRGKFVCENVAYARGSYNSATAATALFNAWMNSTPHKNCMLDIGHASTESAGVGVSQRGSTWWATFIGADDAT
jgi:uncharacterized protein YkwD